jgi:hypothetical protein
MPHNSRMRKKSPHLHDKLSVLRLTLLPATGLLLLWPGSAALAQAASVVYRCPGPPVLYTDALTAKQAQEKGCRSIEGTPITVVQPSRGRSASAAHGGEGAASSGARSGEGRVDPAQQRSRDGERRRVLEAELRESEERLAALQRDYAGGSPERRGDERNYQRYLDRVAELKASITRQESDIQALKREISKLP